MRVEINFKNNTEYELHQYEDLARRALDVAMDDLDLEGPFEISYIFVDEEEIREINNKYRHIDKVTDVITFETGDDDYIADCFISYPYAIKLASQNDLTMENEMAYLFVHGFLHALGYDHPEDAVTCEMFDIQERIVEKVCKD